MCGRQPDARAVEFLGAVQALKRGEEFVDVGHVEPGPVVADIESRGQGSGGRGLRHGRDFRRRFPDLAEFDCRVGSAGGEFPGVAEQVRQQDAKQARIAEGRQVRGNGDCDLAVRLSLA